jgi:AcrR family transcriptional regulator
MFSRPSPRTARPRTPARSNAQRTETTRTALLDAAHALFIDRGYAATGTPEICATAGVTRGALYHHFADKRALFVAVLEREARAVRDAIEAAAPAAGSTNQALRAGAEAYLAAMAERGRTRLLLIDGPAVLGPEAEAIDNAHAGAALRDGLKAVLRRDAAFTSALASLLSAAFDRAARDQALSDATAARKAMRWLLDRVVETKD